MAKTKIKFDPKLFDSFKKRANTEIAKGILTEIAKDITSGISPVRGKGKFDGYSELYKKWKPNQDVIGASNKLVNMTLTGDMIKSLSADVTNDKIEIFFTDEKAAYHNNGDGNLPTRRLLPTNSGELFNLRISKKIKEIIDNIASSFFK